MDFLQIACPKDCPGIVKITSKKYICRVEEVEAVVEERRKKKKENKISSITS
jgi:hypothetical protein